MKIKKLIVIIVMSSSMIDYMNMGSVCYAVAIENNEHNPEIQNFSYKDEEKIKLDTEKKMKLDLLIDDWIEWVKKERDITQSVWGPYVNSDKFQKITRLNPTYVPFIIDRLNKEENPGYKECFWLALRKITKYRDKDKALQSLNNCGHTYQYFLKLRYEGKIYDYIKTRFNENYALIPKSGNSEMKEKAKKELKECGIFALPYAVEAMKDSGDQEGEMLMEYVNFWTDGGLTAYAKEQEKALPSLSKQEKVELARQWWEKKKDSWLISPMKEKQQ
ncbi:MAG: hypothetical protein AB1656_07635 [Candidatus Omnitrophota bacterium]